MVAGLCLSNEESRKIINTKNLASLQLKPSVSDTVTLPYGYYLYVHSQASNLITWSFEGSNKNVEIYLIALDENEYQKAKSGMDFSYYVLSNGRYYADSGDFEVPHSAEWYLLFFNLDLSRQNTDLTYNVEFDPIPFLLELFIIIIVIIIFVLITIIAIIRKRKKKEQERFKEPQAKTIEPANIHIEPKMYSYPKETQPPEKYPIPSVKNHVTFGDIKYCPHCGAKNPISAKFCVECGTSIK
ncbi:MAG: zinc-ribbon domain-containing protein [Promethearchaeota archaeon]